MDVLYHDKSGYFILVFFVQLNQVVSVPRFFSKNLFVTKVIVSFGIVSCFFFLFFFFNDLRPTFIHLTCFQIFYEASVVLLTRHMKYFFFLRFMYLYLFVYFKYLKNLENIFYFVLLWIHYYSLNPTKGRGEDYLFSFTIYLPLSASLSLSAYFILVLISCYFWWNFFPN